ncbi:PLP-dependent aminotransferase family protein [Pseudomonas siliginis]|jgi:DNA-binding transcriptional MocR family regulator|uniref:aminotransferase-like domain-containing protein n=1 Tax=Pseudomonas siliginis TaxID=2842346 RepID=UPI0020925306|nr:PLP-dependent aminotransferase family protein [Pseudomonas siliginis]UST74779.1 PLP-dependent aminotransferase family protein [Pseudomonas siliginis]USU00960.1 PLP-dependent aminotransferase family protein [Pseudomonas siliginis]
MDRFDLPDKRWRIVKDWIIRQIDSGDLAAEAKLPSIRVLARMFETSITTVQRALADLEADAYVSTVPRVGYFVSASGRAKPSGAFDFSSVTVNVNHAVVAMLSEAASRTTASLNSAVLHSDLTPNVLLNKCLSVLAAKTDNTLSGLVAPPGLPALRRRIAGLMLTRGVVCGPDDILVTSGDTIALELALEAVASKGATVAIETPTYYGILQTIERLGMRALPIRTDGRTGLDVDHLEEALKQKKVAVIFLNPTLQNPRGFIMPDEARARLSRIAREADVPIIEDDIFFDLVPEADRPRALKSYDSSGQTIYCSSFSKTIAPGYRVGWCLAGKYRNAILAQMFSRNLAVSSLAQNVLNEFIGRGYMDEHCARLRSQLSSLASFVEALVRTDFPLGTVYVPPRGGFIHWVEMPAHTDMPALQQLATERGCHVAGSGIFFADGQASTGVRICLGTTLTPAVIGILKVIAECAHLAARPTSPRQMPTEQLQELAVS